MPFTFSHPVIVLPLIKKFKHKVSATALIAGSMAPDFEYFINFRMKQIHGHSLEGIFYYNLPLTILLCFGFHFLVRDAIIHYSPRFIKNRWCHFIGYDWKTRWDHQWKKIILSALIGIGSHLLLDSFTHANRFMTDNISLLHHTFPIFGKELPIYQIGQVYGSVFALLVIGYVIIREPIKHEFRSGFRTKIIYWSLVGCTALLTLILRNLSHFEDIVATAIAGFLLGLIIAPKLMKVFKVEEEQEILY